MVRAADKHIMSIGRIKYYLAQHGRAFVGAAFCVLALLVAGLSGGFDRRVRSADVLTGKWTGSVVWNDASGREYNRTMHLSMFFEPDGSVGTVLTLPSGTLGGSGRYVLKDGRLTVHCTGLMINGGTVPETEFSKEAWFHDTAVYVVSSDGTNLTLANPVTGRPTAAPAYPLLLSDRPLVLSRVEKVVPAIVEPAPKE